MRKNCTEKRNILKLHQIELDHICSDNKWNWRPWILKRHRRNKLHRARKGLIQSRALIKNKSIDRIARIQKQDIDEREIYLGDLISSWEREIRVFRAPATNETGRTERENDDKYVYIRACREIERERESGAAAIYVEPGFVVSRSCRCIGEANEITTRYLAIKNQKYGLFSVFWVIMRSICSSFFLFFFFFFLFSNFIF